MDAPSPSVDCGNRRSAHAGAFLDDDPDIGESESNDEVAVQVSAPAATEERAPTAPPTPTAAPTVAATPSSKVESVPDGVPAAAQRATVVNVTDGDTIAVEPEVDGALATNAAHTIRLLLVDTPETVHPSKPEACFGGVASQYTSEQLMGEDGVA